ncbi:MAG: TIGR03960 family B12-binding radical SAM protein [Thermodesulfobacteriota bacterium]
MVRDELIDILPFVRRPSRYIDGEINSIKKDIDKIGLKFALAFPDLYEVGMSYLGIQVLYSILNSHPDVACERVFSPEIDMEQTMRKRKIPISSLESSLPLLKFDVIGFSLQYELSYTNVLNILDLAGIPFYSRDRDNCSTPFTAMNYPLIIGGGPSSMNPEPVADFFDFFLLGDGEESILEMIDVLLKGKEKELKKGDILEDISKIEGAYIPSYFDIKYSNAGRIEEIIPLLSGYKKAKRRILQDIDNAIIPTRPIIPYLQVIHDRLSVEIARGCTRGCRFCQAGFVYRPVRERSLETIFNAVKETLINTGYDEVSLLSLSTGDYSCIQDLILRLMDLLHPDRIALSFPSLRVNSVSPLFMEQVKRVRKTGFTLAPEAGTSRLRNVINKRMDEKKLVDTARWVFGAGWRSIKLYFMIGLPTEEEEDIKGIVALLEEILNAGKRGRITVKANLSTFIPKAHTPFQWHSQISAEEATKKQELIMKWGNGKRLEFKINDPNMSLLEGVFSRGDRRLSRVIHKAHSLGCRLDGWREHFQFKLWQDAFKSSGLSFEFYASRHRDEDECLPWDHIDSGVAKEFRVREYKKALRGEVSKDCKTEECEGCGVCDFDRIRNVVFNPSKIAQSSVSKIERGKNKVLPKPLRLRLNFSKTGDMRFLSHLEIVSTFSRALRRADIPLKFSEGFHPLPRISFGHSNPVGMESRDEYVDIELKSFLSPETLLSRLKEVLPEGIRPIKAKIIPLNAPSLPLAIRGERYVVDWSSRIDVISQYIIKKDLRKSNSHDSCLIIDRFMEKTDVPFHRETKKGKKKFNIRAFVKELSLTDEGRFCMTLDRMNGNMVRPAEVVQGVLGRSERDERLIKVVKIETIFRG